MKNCSQLFSYNSKLLSKLKSRKFLYILMSLLYFSIGGYSQNPVLLPSNKPMPAPVSKPSGQSAGQLHKSKQEQKKQKPKHVPVVLTPNKDIVSTPSSPFISEDVYRFFDKKTDGFYLKPLFILLYSKAEGEVYVTSMNSYLKHLNSPWKSYNSSPLSSAAEAEMASAMAAFKKESDTALVTSDCWNGDADAALFHGETMITKQIMVCKSGCGLKLVY